MLLADGNYPKIPLFVYSIVSPSTESEAMYEACHERRRKDVGGAFGVLRIKFLLIAMPSRLWSSKEMVDVMTTSVIIHNMVVEKQQPLTENIKTSRPESFWNVRVIDDMEYYFEKVCCSDLGVRDSTIAAISRVSNYVSDAF